MNISTRIKPFPRAILLMLTLALAGWAQAKEPHSKTRPADSMQLEIAGNRLTGRFDGVPLKKALEPLHRKLGIVYKLPDDLADHPVSGRFENVAAQQALKTLLEPVNYLTTNDGKGNIKNLSVIGLKDPSSPPGRSANTGPVPPTSADKPKALPKFEPELSPTGPEPEPGQVSSKLPEFKPAPSKTGPPVEPGMSIKLPKFAPKTYPGGPLDGQAGVTTPPNSPIEK